MQQLRTWLKARPWVMIAIPAVCLFLAVASALWPDTPAQFLVLRRPCVLPVPLRDRLTSWIPSAPSWAWAWRLEKACFGRRKPIDLSAEILTFSRPAALTLPELALGEPTFSDPAGLLVWFIAQDHVQALRERLKQNPAATSVAQPRISTADGIGAALFCGQSLTLAGKTNQVGTALECYARVHRARTDLIASVRFSELVTNGSQTLDQSAGLASPSVQTNLDTSFRLQVPNGTGVFLFDASPSHTKPVGVLLAPLQPKKLAALKH